LENDEEVRGQVIKGPWKKRHIKQPDEIEAELEMKMEFAEDLTQELIVHMIQMCNDNEIKVDDKKFLHDIGIVIEFTKGLVYRAMQLKYPTQLIVDKFVQVVNDPDGTVHTEVDIEHLSKFIELFMSEDDNDSS
jgi:hypothetical protein|tara:strand:+ start:568 stop:969 length:402 start_codon:yes stop_codon:yes gene_type:complete